MFIYSMESNTGRFKSLELVPVGHLLMQIMEESARGNFQIPSALMHLTRRIQELEETAASVLCAIRGVAASTPSCEMRILQIDKAEELAADKLPGTITKNIALSLILDSKSAKAAAHFRSKAQPASAPDS